MVCLRLTAVVQAMIICYCTRFPYASKESISAPTETDRNVAIISLGAELALNKGCGEGKNKRGLFETKWDSFH